MGLVSLLKSACKRYYFDIQQFFTARSGKTCEELARESRQTAETCAAAALADSFMLKDLGRNELQDFHIFLQMFNKESLDSEDCKHLKLFYIMIPALTVNFANSFIHTKNTLASKNMNSVYFCDDGFPIGLAYFLKVFGQEEEFRRLNWFDSAIEKYANDQASRSQVLTTEQSMLMKRAEEYQKEFEWIFYSFVAAQQFFKDN
eukprot:TRINITY_DN16468_c0_g1_i3.p1 TRINITY_DN16468_c0_g1~~TRINITY_DN16468_c0_g1_i3.p1  ORF type:complete len:203 (+),score=61.53 TRINITY_DN16468_c0_g1_i3:558-1166(+)